MASSMLTISSSSLDLYPHVAADVQLKIRPQIKTGETYLLHYDGRSFKRRLDCFSCCAARDGRDSFQASSRRQLNLQIFLWQRKRRLLHPSFCFHYTIKSIIKMTLRCLINNHSQLSFHELLMLFTYDLIG